MFLKSLIKESNEFYPEYLLAHSNTANRVLHFIGASLFFGFVILFFILRQWYYLPIAVFMGYLLPGLGHRFFQHNASFRSSKPVICVICATKLYLHTFTFQISKKLNLIESSKKIQYP